MDKETFEEEEDFDLDELLGDEEDDPVIESEAKGKSTKKAKVKPRGVPKKEEQKVSPEVAKVNKELSDMEWQPFSQQAYEGLQNIKTGEVINEREAIRRTLCYAQESARNSR